MQPAILLHYLHICILFRLVAILIFRRLALRALLFSSFPPLFPFLSFPFPSYVPFPFTLARWSGERYSYPQRVRAEPHRKIIFGEFWRIFSLK